MNTILKAEKVSKSFGTGKQRSPEVLKSVSLTVAPQKISVIIGASGAGKSTLLHLLSGMDFCTGGKVFYGETEISKLSPNGLADLRNKKFGFVFQFHHLLPEFTALENVMIPALISGKSKKTATAEATALLKEFGIGHRLGHRPNELSGGEQQRISFARALVNQPEIIFADEPTGNLDSTNSNVIHNYFLRLRDTLGITSVIVTHNKDLIDLADAVYEIKDGKLL